MESKADRWSPQRWGAGPCLTEFLITPWTLAPRCPIVSCPEPPSLAASPTSLERVPEGQLDWTPHDRSFSMRGLVTHLATMRLALQSTDDAALRAEWTFKVKGEVVFAMPRMGVMRAFVMNHMIHHRAQLGVYLRLLGVAVPSLYGPSADEGNPPVS